MTSERKAIIYALTAVLLWSTVATAFKVALQYHSVLSLLAGASLTSLMTFGLVLAVQRRLIAAFSLLTAHWKRALLFGAVNPIGYYLVLFEAYDRLPAQVAQPVNYTWAITLALLSIPVLKHKLNRFDLFGLLLGYAGVTVISVAGKNVNGHLDMLGLGLAIFSTLLWAGFWLLNTRNKLDPLISLFHSFLLATPILIFALLICQEPLNTSFPAMTSVVYVGLFEMGITFIFWQKALHLTRNAARIGTLIFLSPFISLFLISLVLKEPLQLQTFLGLGLIIIGVWLSQRK